MYVQLSDNKPSKFPYTLAELRRDNPGTSFPPVLPDSTLASFDVYEVVSTPAPACDSKTHTLKTWVSQVDGAWLQTWEVQRLPVERASENIRARRNQLLVDCDWTQLPDASVDVTTWSTYRQELRDIPTQTGFPWNVQWPVKPSLLDEQPAVDGSDNIDAGDGSNTISTGDGSNTISTGDGEDTISVIV